MSVTPQKKLSGTALRAVHHHRYKKRRSELNTPFLYDFSEHVGMGQYL